MSDKLRGREWPAVQYKVVFSALVPRIDNNNEIKTDGNIETTLPIFKIFPWAFCMHIWDNPTDETFQ